MTGGFGEPTCQKCHFENPLNDPEGFLRLEGVPAAYATGREYRLTVVLGRAGLKRGGFEMSARFAPGSGGARAGQQAGHFKMSESDPRLQIVTEPDKTVQYLQHTKAGSASPREGEQRWTLTWVAPSAAADPVQFNVAANVANDDNSALGDFIYTRELTCRVPEVRLKPDPTSVPPLARSKSHVGAGFSRPDIFYRLHIVGLDLTK